MSAAGRGHPHWDETEASTSARLSLSYFRSWMKGLAQPTPPATSSGSRARLRLGPSDPDAADGAPDSAESPSASIYAVAGSIS